MDFQRWRLLCAALCVGYAKGADVTVKTSVGTIVGFEDQWQKITVRKFRGIPYAEAPVGNRRFSPPVKKAAFAKPFNAKFFGPACLQSTSTLISRTLETIGRTMSEDCLSLNIYAPIEKGTKKPVMVFFHGGAFVGGAGMMYDGTKMAAQGDVVVVTLNYRLGLLGFFTTSDEAASGNYGLLDQQLALKWVQRNIGVFGGDNKKVTIFGQSSGSASVAWQMLAPSNEGLFHKAIMQSGAALSSWSWPDPVTVKDYVKTIADKHSCNRNTSPEIIACLRQQPFARFHPSWPWGLKKTPGGPRVDGKFIPHFPSCRDKGIRMEDLALFRSTDLLAGANMFEGSPFLGLSGVESDKPINQIIFGHVAGIIVEVPINYDAFRLWQRYKSGDHLAGKELLQFIGDGLFYDGIMKTVKRHSEPGAITSGATYFYSFLPKPSKAVGSLRYFGGTTSFVNNGSIHSDELGFFFSGGIRSGMAPKSELDLSDAMITYWTNFAKTGDPNKPKTVPHPWPRFDIRQQKFIEFNTGPTGLDLKTGSFYRKKYLDRWTDIKPRGRSCCLMTCSGCSTWSATSALLLIMGQMSLIWKVMK